MENPTENDRKPDERAGCAVANLFGEKRTELHHRWRIRKELPDGMFSCCEYNAPFPVAAATVAHAPSVQRWLAGCRIDDIYHPEPESSPNGAAQTRRT